MQTGKDRWRSNSSMKKDFRWVRGNSRQAGSKEFFSEDLKYSRAVECWDLPGVGRHRKGTQRTVT